MKQSEFYKNHRLGYLSRDIKTLSEFKGQTQPPNVSEFIKDQIGNGAQGHKDKLDFLMTSIRG